jgi:hypothetical protein
MGKLEVEGGGEQLANNKQPDAEKQINACMQIANFWAGRHDQHRQYEWKLTLGFWAVIVAGIAYPKNLTVIPQPVWLPVCWITFLAYSYLWLLPLWVSNRRDSLQAFQAVAEARSILQNPTHEPNFPDYKTIDVSVKLFHGDWAMRFEMVATLFFQLAFASVMLFGNENPKTCVLWFEELATCALIVAFVLVLLFCSEAPEEKKRGTK